MNQTSSSWPPAKLSNTGVSTPHVPLSPFTRPVVTFVVLIALVLATGSKWPGPINLPEGSADLGQFVAQWREKFRAAPDIVVVGGGAVGLELSGEIRDEYPVRDAINMPCLDA